MKKLKYLISLAALVISSFAQSEPFTQAAFDKLLKSGKPTLVEVHAAWCSTCKKQSPITNALLKEKPYRLITPLRVDFDNQKDVVRDLRVRWQSTLIVYKGGKEVSRSTGDTTREGIESLLKMVI
jgi:thioredoxin 1